MKNLILSICMLISFLGNAQTNIFLDIEHFLGTTPFAYNTTSSNNLGNDFNVGRLQYYISQITLVHDGGTETVIPNLWILVDADTKVSQDLGSHSITELEAIKFGIGVEQNVNHDDPSSYPMSHPLYHQNPSMHWGWTAGYRFVCMEGKAGSSLTQIYEIHALGDLNYGMAEVAIGTTIGSGDYHISLYADYNMALEDIDVSSGLINHGEDAEAADLLYNFGQKVFTRNIPLSTDDILSKDMTVQLFPNPTINQLVTIQLDELGTNTSVRITDITGKELNRIELNTTNTTIQLPSNGIYLVSIYENGVYVSTQKVVSAK